MKNIQWTFLFFAIAAASCMIGLGIAIGERSLLGIIFSIILLIFVMGFGFATKKKMRENGK